MTCQHCGKATNYDFEFCPVCGKPAYTPEQPKPGKSPVAKIVLWIFLAINIVFFTFLVITRMMETIDGDYHNEWWICIVVFAGGFITTQALMVKYGPQIKAEDRYNRLLWLPLLAALSMFVVWLDLDTKNFDQMSDYNKWNLVSSYLVPLGSLVYALFMVLTRAKRRSAVPALLIVLATEMFTTVVRILMMVEEYKEFYTWDKAMPMLGYYLVEMLMLTTAAILMFPALKEKKQAIR